MIAIYCLKNKSIDTPNYLSILLRGAAMRILITRLHDQLFHPKGAFVEPKKPEEYVKILKFHQDTNIRNYLL